MKTAPDEIDPKTHPELACLQAIIHDEDRPPEGEQMHHQPLTLWKHLFGVFLVVSASRCVSLRESK